MIFYEHTVEIWDFCSNLALEKNINNNYRMEKHNFVTIADMSKEKIHIRYFSIR